MRQSNNSSLVVCVDNLMKTVQGEVPYSRGKGLGPDLVDTPSEEMAPDLAESVDDCIEAYEPRVDLSMVSVETANRDGRLEYKIEVAKEEEDGD